MSAPMASGMNLPTSSFRSQALASRVMISTILRRICLIWLVCAYAVFFTCAPEYCTSMLERDASHQHCRHLQLQEPCVLRSIALPRSQPPCISMNTITPTSWRMQSLIVSGGG